MYFILSFSAAFWSGLEELHSLVEQAETKAFPHIHLLDQLRSVTAEADKVAVMAQQLLNGKRQTRYYMKTFGTVPQTIIIIIISHPSKSTMLILTHNASH